MSGREDVFDLEDLRRVSGRVGRALTSRRVAAGVALAVIAVGLVLAAVPHVFGAVGADAVSTGSSGPSPAAQEDTQQRYQNYLTNLTFVFAPIVLPAVAVAAAFAGGLRSRGSRAARVGTVVAGAVVGVAVGYCVFVLVGQAAFGEATDGFIVDEYPPTLHPVAIATNALALAAAGALGSALAAFAATLVDDDVVGTTPSTAAGETVRADGDARPGDRVEASPTGGATESEAGADDTDSSSDDAAGAATEEEGDGSPRRERPDDAGRASEYRETGPAGRGNEPRYDPRGRDWDGRDDER